MSCFVFLADNLVCSRGVARLKKTVKIEKKIKKH